MDIQQFLTLIIVAGLIFLALVYKPLRKTIGLLLVILGFITCLTFIGIVFGIPMIIVGGLLLFI